MYEIIKFTYFLPNFGLTCIFMIIFGSHGEINEESVTAKATRRECDGDSDEERVR